MTAAENADNDTSVLLTYLITVIFLISLNEPAVIR